MNQHLTGAPLPARQILDSAIDFAMVATDLDGLVTDWNAGARHILQWDVDADSMLGESLETIFTAEDRAAGRMALEMQQARDRNGGSSERWHLRRDGSRFRAAGEMMVLNDDDGRHVGYLKILRDRTVQYEADVALRESDERYRTLFESMDDGFCIIELMFDAQMKPVDYRFVEVNAVFASQTGLADARGRTALELVPDLEPVWFEMYGKVALTGQPLRFMDHSKSLGRWFEVQAFRTGTAERRQVALLFKDITERREGELHQAALLHLADRLRDLTEPGDITAAACELLGSTLQAGIVGYGVVDEAAETLVVSGTWGSALAPTLGGMLRFRDFGSYVDDLVQRRTVAVADVFTDSRTGDKAGALQAGDVRAFVNLPIFEGGVFVALLFVLSPTPRQWKPGELALIRDFADRTRVAAERAAANLEKLAQAEQLRALNASLERQVRERTADRNALWQLSKDIMLRSTFDGRITAVNPAWTQVLGWREDELLGSNLFDLIHPEDMAHTLEGARELSGGESHGRFDNRYRARDGAYRWISWSTRPGDGLINAVGRDITAEKEAAEALKLSEEALRQSQKMEAVGQLTGGLAHDFNNLLAGISGALELLQRRLAQGRTTDLERYIVAAQGAARRAAALTHRLLAFSRRQTLAPKATDANRLVAGMEDLIRRTIGPQVALEVVTAGGLWPTLVDPPQLENALLNLCINSRDAMPDGGRITIETANKWLDERAAAERDLAPGQYVCICVSDTGTGMTPDVISKAFDPFFTTKPIGQGTGLGLSMIYGFVRQSGGQVRVYSEVDQGTTLCLYLPRHHKGEDRSAEEARAEAPRAEAGETVLVVDDEPTVRMLVTEVLQELGYTAVEAADGPEGLRLLDTQMRVDLLITDVGLPGGMNGRQVADAARVARPELKVLFITGYAENAVMGNGHLDPGMEVLTKPFAVDDLAGRIRQMIAG